MQAVKDELPRCQGDQYAMQASSSGALHGKFANALEGFIANAETWNERLSSQCGDMLEEVEQLVGYFGESLAECNYDKLCTTLTSFLQAFMLAAAKRAEQIKKAKRAAKKSQPAPAPPQNVK
jgi:hypothetical protein